MASEPTSEPKSAPHQLLAVEPSQQSAPLGRRFGAMLYEGVLLFGVSFIAGYLFDTLTQSRQALMFRHAREMWLFTVYGVYFVYFWTHGGQTLAMKTWRIRLMFHDRLEVPLGVAIVRYFACWVFVLLATGAAYALGLGPAADMLVLAAALVLPPFMMLILPQHQFLYDYAIGTRLVNVLRPDALSGPSARTA
jgi:uncharacterized RDD family membrane protein YckC